MKKLLTLLGLAFAGCNQLGGPDGTAAIGDGGKPSVRAVNDDDDEEEIALSELPALVRSAAFAAVPGFTLQKAEKELENGVVVYCLEGTLAGKAYEIDVSAEGQVLDQEQDDDDPDDPDDDDGDDDDEDED
jgi:hypothetical protein